MDVRPVGSARAVGRVAVVGTALVALLAGCTPPAASPSPSPTSQTTAGPTPEPLPPGVTVEVRQARVEWADRIVRVRVSNDTADALAVSSAEIAGARWAGPARSLDPVTAGAGGVAEVRVRLGEARCGQAGAADVLTLVVEADRDDAAPRPVAVFTHVLDDAADPGGVLTRRWQEDCAAAAVAAGARLSWSPGLEVVEGPAGPLARLTLRLEPVPGGPHVEVAAVDATTLLSPAEGPQWRPALASADGQPVTATLDAVPARCDLHAIAEDKRGWQMPVRASVDGVAQEVFYLPLPDDSRVALPSYLSQACGRSAG
ncbi:hypothetical protein QUV83_04420 [Cellulomonas cellasea]|uniref:hypothetical protein n=1 Tax=Cellulomonas cellasea TaxID=43670 RepID=UPI0025A39965|nr:hypothetical protein [Cellulomonas cellasea]MDM8084007.1 hypothetical protein [Cellulomonas cellasea]